MLQRRKMTIELSQLEHKQLMLSATLDIAQRVYDRYGEEADAPTMTIKLRLTIEALGLQLLYLKDKYPELFERKPCPSNLTTVPAE
jgi:hypothetical protein